MKETISKVKRQPSEWVKIIANEITDTEFISKIYKPLQCSCLENPRDGGACWAAIYGIAQSQTWLKRLSSMQLNTRKMKDPIKKWTKNYTDISTKKTYRLLTNTWKDAQHYSLSMKCKSKAPCGTISHQSEWLSSESLQTIIAGEGVEKREHSFTISGNAD